jgi:carbon storage regulator
MLVLSRKAGERIVIGDDVEVVVVAASTGRVKLAIQAPREVPVHRAEVRQRMARTQAARDVQPRPLSAPSRRPTRSPGLHEGPRRPEGPSLDGAGNN